MSERSVQADVVKKAILKYKASKLRGTTGNSVQGPKTYKDFYIVFRAVSGERKELEIYSNERRFHEAGPPKLLVDLKDAVGIHVMNGKRSEFYVELSDGGMCLFEAKNPEESMDWVSCLNAVLYAKGPNGEGSLQYEVDLQESELLTYQGPAILELIDGELIVNRKDNHSEIVKWRLSHIRSFKAKKRLLTIFSGSRSSTGVGEFLFKSERSVEITHAIETVVGAMAKDKKSTKLTKAGHFPLPRPPIQNGGAGLPRNWSSSIVDSIPDFQPPVVYEDIPESEAHISNFDTEGYGKLNFKDIPHGARSPPILVSPEHEGGPRRGAGAMGGARHTSPTPRPTHPASSSRAMVPARKGGRRDYEDLDLDEGDEEEQRRSVPATAPENYSRLEREKSPARKFSPPDKPTPYKSGGKPHPPPTSNRPSPHGPPLPSRPHVPPSSAKPSDIPTDVPDGLYAAVSKPKKRTAATVHGSRPLLPPTAAKPSLSGSNPDLSKLGSEDYGKLDRRVPVAVPHPEDEYNTLDLVASKMNGSAPSVGQEAYGKLEHISSRGFSVVTSPPHVAEQYGKLELTKTNASVVPPASHYEMQEEQSPSLPSTSSAAAAASIVSPQGKEYGKLHQFSGLPSSSSTTGASGAAVTPSRSQPLPPPQEEYGRLERPTGKTVSVPSTPEDEYGHLETRPRTSSFNPYGTLSAEEMKAAAAQASTNKNGKSSGSAGNADSQVMGPPPGYENTEIKQPSPAYRASVHVTSSQSLAKPQAPPRGTNASPPLQKKTVHGYVNIDEKGQVKKGSPPLPPAKPHLESFTPSARAHSKSTTDSTSTSSNSHDPSLKSHDPTPLKSHGMNGASFPVKRKPIVSSSDYEDTEKLDFGTKPAGNSQKFISTSNIAVLPPTAPRRGASIRSAVSASNVVSENSSKPSVAPKPSKVKLRQAVH